MVLNLQKEVQEKDNSLTDISEKLSRKSEECESLMEERDIMRTKSSFDLQQVSISESVLITVICIYSSEFSFDHILKPGVIKK